MPGYGLLGPYEGSVPVPVCDGATQRVLWRKVHIAGEAMRLLLKLLAIIIFGPIVLGLLLIVAVVAIVGLPLLWEQLTAKLTSPPERGTAES